MIFQIARREIVTRGRSKAYLISSVILVLLAIAGVVVLALVEDDSDERRAVTIGHTGLPAAVTERIGQPQRSDLDITFQQLAPAEVDAALDSGDVDVVVEDGPALAWNETEDPEIRFAIESALAELELSGRANDVGISESDLASILAPLDVGERFVDAPTDEDEVKLAVGLIGILVTLIAIQIYGQQLMMAVVEEKASRVVEVLLAHIRPRELLIGKLLGFGVLVIAQIVVVLVGCLVGLSITDVVEVPLSAILAVPLIFVTFVLGFALYSALFALLGSLVSRQEDAQQVIAPALLPMFAGYIIGIQVLSSPDSTLAEVTAVIPFTSSFVLPVVVAADEASVGLVIVSVALLALTVGAVLRLAGKIYEFTLLHTGTRISFRDALRLARREELAVRS